MEWKRDKFRIVDDPGEINIEVVSRLLAETYWGHRRPRAIVEKLIRNSLCFSLLSNHEQVGFARVATDYTVFSWLSDLVIADVYRNQGLGEWMLECILTHPSVSRTQFVLQTRSAYKLYERFGFETSDKLMTRVPPAT
jgi:GNAT superfamily N-acetyltransferase